MKYIKIIFNWLDDVWPLLLGGVVLYFTYAFIYKICVGAYHLLEKLIDKI